MTVTERNTERNREKEEKSKRKKCKIKEVGKGGVRWKETTKRCDGGLWEMSYSAHLMSICLSFSSLFLRKS